MPEHTASESRDDRGEGGNEHDENGAQAADAKPGTKPGAKPGAKPDASAERDDDKADDKGDKQAADDGDDDDGEEGDDKGDDKQSKLKNPKVRLGLIVAGVVAVVAFAVWFTYYWTTGRYLQSTDDAFVQADQATISSKIPGYVEALLVRDNENVVAGQPLVRINAQDVRSARDQAAAQVVQGEAQIIQIEAQINQQRAQIAQADAQVAGARTSLANAQIQVDRYEPLTAMGAQTAEQLTQMRQTRDQASSQLKSARAQRLSAGRQVETLRAQIIVAKAQIEASQAQLRKSNDDVASTVVRSLIAGRVGDRTVQVGQYVQPNTRLMSVVPVQDLYVVANFKETQVGLMRIGQPVTLAIDALVSGSLQGTVESFAPGTGSQFALLPPQNATGNFTKVVQRVPVRIHIDEEPEARKVLLPGLSVVVTVDTLGSKAAKERADRESKRREDQRKSEAEAAESRNRTASQAGPGQ